MLIIPDVINGTFEFLGGFFILNHCRVLFQEKKVAGISIISNTFFTLWGIWNLYYYPYLGQWLSFCGGLFIVLSNMLWIAMMLHYRKTNDRKTNEM